MDVRIITEYPTAKQTTTQCTRHGVLLCSVYKTASHQSVACTRPSRVTRTTSPTRHCLPCSCRNDSHPAKATRGPAEAGKASNQPRPRPRPTQGRSHGEASRRQRPRPPGPGGALRLLRRVPQQPRQRGHPRALRLAHLAHRAAAAPPHCPVRARRRHRRRGLRGVLLPPRPPRGRAGRLRLLPLLGRQRGPRRPPRLLRRMEGCIGVSVVLLDYAIHWSWSFREASSCSPRQSYPGFLDGSILCAARASSHNRWVRTISWLPRQGEQVDRRGPEGMGGQEIKEIIMRCV